MEAICKAAFDGGITHFDLANNYGPPAGAAEQNFGKILKTLFAGYRDELIISTKAGFNIWIVTNQSFLIDNPQICI